MKGPKFSKGDSVMYRDSTLWRRYEVAGLGWFYGWVYELRSDVFRDARGVEDELIGFDDFLRGGPPKI